MKKVYVKVNVDFDSDGNMVPKRIIWEDGTDYEIDRILAYSPREARRDIGAAGTLVCRGERLNTAAFSGILEYRGDTDVRTLHAV